METCSVCLISKAVCSCAPLVQKELPGIETTLEERELIHGNFNRRAVMAMALKRATVASDGLQDLADDERHAVDMICEKLSRICSGNPHYADTWRDIAGYAMLVYQRLENDNTLT